MAEKVSVRVECPFGCGGVVGHRDSPSCDRPMSTGDFTVYTWGLVYASVCTSLPVMEAQRRLNLSHPTGIMSGWSPAEDRTFADGDTPNPCPCDQRPTTHKHYLFSC